MIGENKIPLPSGVSSFSNIYNIDEEKIKKYTLKDLVWSLKVLNNFKEARENLLEVLKILAEAGIDTSKVNWNDPFSVMQAFLQVKGMGIDVDINYIIERMESLDDISFADINKALDIIETFMVLSSRAEKIAKSISKRGYTAKEFDMLMGLLGVGNSGKSVKIDVEDVESEDEDEVKLTDEELDRIRSIIDKYRNKF